MSATGRARSLRSATSSTIRSRGWQVVDPLRSTRRAVYVTGSARSGTTWVAELLTAPAATRLVFEPLHHRSRVGRLGLVPHVEPGEGGEALRRAIRDALDGGCRDPWVNTFQRRAVVTRRVVKDIRPGLLPVVRSVAPDVPVLLVVRDPLAVGASRARLEAGGAWFDTTGAVAELRVHRRRDDRLGHLAEWAIELVDGPLGVDPRTPHVAIWVVENAIAIDAAGPSVTVLRYEELVADPARGAMAVAAAAGVRVDALGDMDVASSTRFAAGDDTTRPADGTVERADPEHTEALRAAAAVWLPSLAGPTA